MGGPRVANIAALSGAITVLWTAVALAAATPAEKCEAAKLNAAGKYAACRLGAEKKAVLKAIAPDYTKCDAKQLAGWTKAESKYGASCPTSGDQAGVRTDVTNLTTCLTGDLQGAPTTCDLAQDAHVLQTGQTTAYGTGSDGDLQEGVVRSYTDNGDGTVTDNKTGLMWEKKDRSGGIHDYGNGFTWSAASFGSTNIMDGAITTTFLAALNAGGGFAGNTDWRIPNRFELESILNLQNFLPTVDAVFNTGCVASCTVTACSCTAGSCYWSSTTVPGPSPSLGSVICFDSGTVGNSSKNGSFSVRAVRGGS